MLLSGGSWRSCGRMLVVNSISEIIAATGVDLGGLFCSPCSRGDVVDSKLTCLPTYFSHSKGT